LTSFVRAGFVLLGEGPVSLPGYIVSSTEACTELHNVHGGTGRVLWKVFALGGALYGDLESFEYCRIPPGASLGMHVHARSEEIYFIIAGRGTMRLGMETREVGPGDLVVTALGSRHAVEAIGEEDLEFVCAEAMPPAVSAMLPDQSPVVAD
jgi:mannose-6-phosphate isomerase-like protein (cupin superfamily)